MNWITCHLKLHILPVHLHNIHSSSCSTDPTFIFLHASYDHINIPWINRSAEFVEGMFQFIDFVFEVVDVQVLRTDTILDPLLSVQRQRAGMERQQHEHTSSPHTAAAAAAGRGGDGGVCGDVSPSESSCQEKRSAAVYNGALQTCTALPALSAIRQHCPFSGPCWLHWVDPGLLFASEIDLRVNLAVIFTELNYFVRSQCTVSVVYKILRQWQDFAGTLWQKEWSIV